MAGEFQNQFQEAMREAEMADLKKEVDGLNDAAKGFSTSLATHLDPLNSTESTKWEPKVDSSVGANTALNPEDDVKSAIEAGLGTDAASQEAVTGDGYSSVASDGTEAASPTVQAVTADGYSPSIAGGAAAVSEAPAPASPPGVEAVVSVAPALPSAPAIASAPSATPSAAETVAPMPEGGGRA